MTFDDLSKKISYLPQDNQKKISEAYNFARKIHQHEKRGTGESYIQHPLHVAYFLAENQLDASTIIGALLHDTLESNPKIQEEIKQKFGKEIFDLTEGVTKLGKIKIKKSWFYPIQFLQERQRKQLGYERHVESLRKMFIAMSKDIRIILIKFADRLHNMQTLAGVRDDKRKRIAQETLEIYSPIAHRLGMGKLKGTLEDLAFPYAFPKEYEQAKKLVGKSYETKEKVVDQIIPEIKKILTDHKINFYQIDGRKKHLYSLWKKLQRYDYELDKIHDIIAVRVIVKSIEDCYKVLGLIHKNWRPLIGRIKDYIAVPKPNAYQSLHTTIFTSDGEIIEIQIRTQEMHYQAEYGIASHWHYSEQALKKNRNSLKVDRGQIGWVTELARWQEKLTDENEWIKGLNLDFFGDRIFVFTPQGDIHDLPRDATPVDFAYSIHTEVGNHCNGAKVNSKLVRLDYKLSNGDIVQIFTDLKNKGPKRDWLKFVKTQRARSKIKSHIGNGLILGR